VPGIQRIGNVFYRVAEHDMDAAVRFYTEVLGFPMKLRDGNRWAAFDVAGATLALEGGATGGDGSGGATVSLRVDGLAVVVDELRRNGAAVGAIEAGPHENRAVLTDPAGNHLVLYEPAAR
jgi:catechol 2,3-dioxygenase-like lactoylglutathione lyase family enzyme